MRENELDEAAAWAAKLEVFRRSVDLRVDAEGHWFHDGVRFEHPRLIELFSRGLDLHPDTGEPILRVDGKWCYVRADDTPFVVRALRLEGGALVARLNTGERVELADDALRARDDHVYAQLDDRREARLDRATQNGLGALLDDTADGELRIGARWRIAG